MFLFYLRNTSFRLATQGISSINDEAKEMLTPCVTSDATTLEHLREITAYKNVYK